jgi:tetratricopeptide (TPR) repeat protein
MEHNTRGLTAESASVRHLVALGYEDPLEVAAQQADLEQLQRAQLATAEMQLKSGDVQSAIATLEPIVEAASEWAAPRHLLARAYFRTGNWTAVVELLNWLEWHGVEHAEFALLRAKLALRARSLDAARDHAAYANALQQPLAAADALIGEVEFRRGDLAAAANAFRRALEGQGAQAAAMAGLAAIALRRNEMAESIDWSLQAIEQEPRMATAHYRLGLALLKLQRLPEATAAFEAAAALNPVAAGPYRWLAKLAAGTGDLDLAEKYRRLGANAVARRRAAANTA